MEAIRPVSDEQRVGDKIRVRSGQHARNRGRISDISPDCIEVVLDDGSTISFSREEITNYSLAARKAWRVMPKRAGRPTLDASQRKKMVSIRLDVDNWERLHMAVTHGLIDSQEQMINSWLRRGLDELFSQSFKLNTSNSSKGESINAEDTNTATSKS